MTLHPVAKMCALAAISAALAIVGLTEAHGSESACEAPTHCVLMRMRQHVTDAHETVEQTAARLLPVARGIDEATDDIPERAALIALGRHESHFAGYVLDGRCSDGPRGKHECDEGRAVGPWQIWRLPQREVPQDATGQARMALGLLRGFRRSCGSLEGAFSMYARGGLCTWAGASARVQTARTVEAMLWRAAK